MIVKHIQQILDKTDSINSNVVDILHIQSQLELNKRLLSDNIVSFDDKKINDIYFKNLC